MKFEITQCPVIDAEVYALLASWVLNEEPVSAADVRQVKFDCSKCMRPDWRVLVYGQDAAQVFASDPGPECEQGGDLWHAVHGIYVQLWDLESPDYEFDLSELQGNPEVDKHINVMAKIINFGIGFVKYWDEIEGNKGVVRSGPELVLKLVSGANPGADLRVASYIWFWQAVAEQVGTKMEEIGRIMQQIDIQDSEKIVYSEDYVYRSAALEQRDWIIFLDRLVEESSYQEMAERFGLSEGYVGELERRWRYVWHKMLPDELDRQAIVYFLKQGILLTKANPWNFELDSQKLKADFGNPRAIINGLLGQDEGDIMAQS